MNLQSDTLRRAMEALESICMMTPACASVLAPDPTPLPPEPLNDSAEWRESLAQWMDCDCIGHWCLQESVSRLHVAFSEWAVGQGHSAMHMFDLGEAAVGPRLGESRRTEAGVRSHVAKVAAKVGILLGVAVT